MAGNTEQLAILQQGVEAWNAWRRAHPETPTNLSGAKLSGVTLTGADLTGADLTGADLTGADLTGFILTGFIPSVADLNRADLSGANLNRANLTGVTLTRANLSRANLIDATLTRADLTGANLTGGKLIGANLSRATLSRATLTGADLSDAIIRGATLIDATLTRATLTRADLTGANLTDAINGGANLIGADLTGADLTDAFISYATLTRTILTRTILTRAYLNRADLTGANLNRADLTGANLSGANLSGADLTLATLSRTNLTSTDMSNTMVGETHFADLDLRTVKGLETVAHRWQSHISITTIYRSAGQIPDSFLRKAGVPENFLVYLPSLVDKAIEYYTCFISYSSKDQEFVERLYADLQSRGVRCWFAPEDLKIGDKIRQRIDESIRLYDKLLLVLSEQSVASEWVEFEVETALEKERKQKRTVLFPIRLDDHVMLSDTAWAANIRRTRHIGKFIPWKDHDAYQKGLQRLLRDLKTETSHVAKQE